jgi:glyoxylase-like metal-dependent hydrolase (beta-lactamase superfamily II)
MPHEIIPGLYRLAVPLPENPLGTVNVYAVISEDGLRLIDCGWDTPEAYAALVAELQTLGAKTSDIREIIVTHIHPDHFGLAERLVAESGARLSMHRLEAIHVGARYEYTRTLIEEMEAWLRVNGVPPDELVTMSEGSLLMVARVGKRHPDIVLEGGELLAWSPYRFEVVWTPGHSTGLICLYEPQAQVLVSSDHVLERISPHVGLHTQSFGNPLGDYLSSLQLVRALPVKTILPGHGAPFHDLPGRVDALLQHHEQRLQAMLMMLADEERTAYNVASRLPWHGSADGWQRLPPFQRRAAVSETIAHLEYLFGQGQLMKRFRGGVVFYQPVQKTTR